MELEAKEPKVRFGEFTGEWEEEKLGTYLKTPEKIKIDVKDKSQLLTVKLNLGGVVAGANRETLSLGATTYYRRHAGQFIYGKQNFFNGSMAIIPEELDGKGSSGDVPSFDITNIDSNYLMQYVSRKSYWKPKVNEATGTGSKRIHEKTLQNFDISIPSRIEQNTIGKLFNELDYSVTLHQQELEELKESKKTLLSKMFPKEGADRPEIRFAGFTDPWEQRKLGDISKVIDPHPSHRAPAATEEGIPFIGIGDVNEVGNINYKTARIVDAKIFDEHHNRYDLSIPSIGIGRVASLGKVIRLRDDIGKYVVSPTMSVIQFTNNNDLDFLYSNMNTPIFQKQFKSFSNGSTRQSVGIQDLRILMVSLPVDIEEQQKIGPFFNRLDNTIALHQQELENLKALKKTLLNLMFV